MILFFYNLVLLAALVISAPWWLFRMATTQKYREGLLERLGLVRPDLVRPVGRRPVIWLHAVSVGEVLAITRLVKDLDAALPDYLVAVSTTTRTGQALARERFGAQRVFYCPLDLPWAVRAYLNALQPRLLVLAETEFWPNLLSGLAALSAAARLVEAFFEPLELPAGAEPSRRPAPHRSWLPAGMGHGCWKFEVRRARRQRSRSNQRIAKAGWTSASGGRWQHA